MCEKTCARSASGFWDRGDEWTEVMERDDDRVDRGGVTSGLRLSNDWNFNGKRQQLDRGDN